MQIRLTEEPLQSLTVDALVAPVFLLEEGESQDANLEAWSTGLLAEMRQSGEMKGKPFSSALVHRPGGAAAKRLLLVGAGPRKGFGPAMLRRVAATAVRALKPKGVRSLAFGAVSGIDARTAAQALIEGVEMGGFEPDVYKTEARAEGSIEELVLALPGEAQPGVDRGAAVALGQRRARELANEPGKPPDAHGPGRPRPDPRRGGRP